MTEFYRFASENPVLTFLLVCVIGHTVVSVLSSFFYNIFKIFKRKWLYLVSTTPRLKPKGFPSSKNMNEEKLDIKDNNRTYYYNIHGKMMPDHESMTAYLLDEGILCVTLAVDRYNGKECVGLLINVNDYFVPASDVEMVTYDELPKLYDLYKERKYDGVAQFVADKRGIPNIYWRDEGSDFQKRVKEKS